MTSYCKEANALTITFILFIIMAVVSFSTHAADITIIHNDPARATILYNGDVEKDDAAKLFSKVVEVLIVNPETKIDLVLNSLGGSVDEGWELAHIIRSENIKTWVLDKCYSACTYAFMGGTNRTIGVEGKLGFHPASRRSAPANESSNGSLRRGQWLAMYMAANMSKYLPKSKLPVALDFITDVYATTDASGMAVYHNKDAVELYKAGIITHAKQR